MSFLIEFKYEKIRKFEIIFKNYQYFLIVGFWGLERKRIWISLFIYWAKWWYKDWILKTTWPLTFRSSESQAARHMLPQIAEKIVWIWEKNFNPQEAQEDVVH